VLARAMVGEMRTWPEVNWLELDEVAALRGVSLGKRLELVGPAFAKPAAIPELQPEAELRWGSSELRAYRAQQALEHFDRMAPTTDAYLLFLKHLFRARALEAVGPPEKAIDAYRSAIAIAPGAQSARLGLAGLLARENRRVEAATLVHETLAIRADSIIDPWLAYGAGDQRFWPMYATELRRLLRQ
jgi:tetratricopeptide (TPR) repeat protein